MLVLSRQKDDSIMIGDNVEVIIVDVRGDKVRLGITAPKDVSVHRREVYDAIQREKAEQAKAEKEANELVQKEKSEKAEKPDEDIPEILI
mgnify:CR=1 FL=1